MICPHCGEWHPDDSNFCPNDGTPISSDNLPSHRPSDILSDNRRECTPDFRSHVREEETTPMPDPAPKPRAVLQTTPKPKHASKPNAQTTTAPKSRPNSSRNWLIAILGLVVAVLVSVFYLQSGESSSDNNDDKYPGPSPVGNITPQPLYLAARKGTTTYYFSRYEWTNLSYDEKSDYSPLGIYITSNGEEFILDLNNSPVEYDWNVAVNRFGQNLPSKYQAELIDEEIFSIDSAIKDFGGDKMEITWTRDDDEYENDRAWTVPHRNVSMHTAFKTDKYKVRQVYPVPAY